MEATLVSVRSRRDPSALSPCTAAPEGSRPGAEDRFEARVRALAARLLPVARGLLSRQADAATAVLRTFRCALREDPDLLRAAGEPSTLLRSLVAVCLEHPRRLDRPDRPIEDLLPRFDGGGRFARPPRPWPAPPTVPGARAATRAAAALPRDHRVALILDAQGMTAAEAGRVLGLPERVVQQRLHRARQALQTILERAGTRRVSAGRG